MIPLVIAMVGLAVALAALRKNRRNHHRLDALERPSNVVNIYGKRRRTGGPPRPLP